jgi:hypothetical protein
VAAVATAALCCGGVALADAGGAGTETLTQHAHNVVLFTMPVTNPCTGDTGMLTATSENEVFHVTAQADGTFWVTQTDEGTATFTPNSPGTVSATGHFTSWFGESSNNRSSVQHDTNNFHLTNTDGSHVSVHIIDHITVNGQGVATASFSVMNVSCS